VRALVGGKDEEWAQLIHGEAEFSFAGSATTICNDTAEYTWDFGDHETATGKNVTHIYEAPGIFTATLTVRCKGCARIEQSDTVRVAVLALTHLVSPNFGDVFKRTDLGPNETALLRVLPQETEIGAALTFDLVGPGEIVPFPPGTEAHYTAPDVTGVATVAVSAPLLRNSMLVQFKTFQPNRITFTRDTVVHYPNGTASAGMTLDAELHALDDQGVEHPVSFDFIEVIDLRAFPEDVEGYFATLPLPTGFDSDPLGGFVQVNAFNRIEAFLAAALEGTVFQPPPPWALGRFIFRMPWEYRVINDPNATSHQITVVGREFQMDGPESPHGAGTVTVVQDAACVSRSPDNTFIPCLGN
jgi:hypothetical protein